MTKTKKTHQKVDKRKATLSIEKQGGQQQAFTLDNEDSQGEIERRKPKKTREKTNRHNDQNKKDSQRRTREKLLYRLKNKVDKNKPGQRGQLRGNRREKTKENQRKKQINWSNEKRTQEKIENKKIVTLSIYISLRGTNLD